MRDRADIFIRPDVTASQRKATRAILKLGLTWPSLSAGIRSSMLAALLFTSACADATMPDPLAQVAQEVTVNDPLFAEQAWSYQTTHVTDAWNLTMGGNVRVGVIDSGSMPHPDLVWGVGHNFILWGYGFNQSPDITTAAPGRYHGIHVAGIIGATANNGIGGLGICPGCTLLPLQVSGALDPQPGFPSNAHGVVELTDAIRWAAGADLPNGERRADVINISQNTTSRRCSDVDQAGHQMQDIRDAFQLAFDRNLAIVVSAGNFGENASSSARFPADCPHAIAVGATERTLDALAPYSDHGPGIAVVAPGGGFNNPPPIDPQHSDFRHYGTDVGAPLCDHGTGEYADPFNGTNGVVSTWVTTSPAGTPTFCYRHVSGTSMAAPHVTGIVGLMLSMNHDLTPTQIAQYLTATARPEGVTCPVPGQCGAGLVDANRAVRAAIYGLIPRLDLSPGSFAFAPRAVGMVSPVNELTVSNQGPVRLDTTIAVPSQFELTCGSAIDCVCTTASCVVQVGGGEKRVLSLRFRPPAPGAFTQSLTISSNDPAAPSVVIPLTGTGLGATITRDDPVGPLLAFRAPTTSGSVVIHNSGNAPLRIDGWRIDPAATYPSAFTIDNPAVALPFSLAAGATFEWKVSCVPKKPEIGTIYAGFLLDTSLGVGTKLVDISCSDDMSK